MFFVKSMLGLVLIGMGFGVSAAPMFKPYVGLDILQRNMNFKQNYGDTIFARKSLQNNIYMGMKMSEHLGCELGYQSTQNTSKNSFVSNGNQILGQLAQPRGVAFSPFVFIETTARIKGPYLGLMGFRSMHQDKTQFIASLGFSVLTAKLAYNQKQYEDPPTVGVGVPAIGIATIHRYFSSTKVVPRCMIGVQRKFTDSLGLRVSFIYEWTNRFKQMAAQNPLNQSNAFLPGNGDLIANLRNSLTYGLGIFAEF